jgi:ribosomal protein S18 acetylase RimI-like enzyme
MTASRPATLSDILLLLEWESSLYAEDGSSPFSRSNAERALGELLADPGLGLAWILQWQGHDAGYLLLTWSFSLEYHGRDAFVDELYILPDYRNRGLGAYALTLAEDACRARGVGALHLEVERSNPRAQAFYRRAGFKDHDRYLMSKPLGDRAEEPR